MGCVVLSSFVPFLSHFRIKNKQPSPRKLLWLLRNGASATPLQDTNTRQSPSVTKNQALTVSCLAQGVSSTPATSGDISVLLQTSALLLLVYWIANFVVPDILIKPLQFDKPNRDQQIPEDKIPTQDE